MRNYFVFGLLVIILLISTLAAQEMYVTWGVQFGTEKDDFARDVTSDASGNVYVVGETSGSLGTAAGKRDGFIVKFDNAGEQQWIRQIGTTGIDNTTGIAVDSEQHVYVFGQADKQLGDQVLAKKDVYMQKYNPDGTLIWTQQIGTMLIDSPSHHFIDEHDYIYAVGHTTGGWAETNAGSYDVFVFKMDTDGNLVWVSQLGSTKSDNGRDITVNAAGEVFITGFTTGGMQGDNLGDQDCFCAKLDSTGKQQWIKQFGSSSRDNATGIALDNNGNIYIGGWTGGVMADRQHGGGDAFLALYDANGTHLWTKQFGTGNWDGAHGVAATSDGSGDVLVGGCWIWPTCHGWIRRYSNSGNMIWEKQVYNNASKSSCGQTVAIDQNGNCFHVGGTDDDLFQTSAGSQDGFLVKISTTNSVQQADEAPQSYHLFQNYPNPFNASTTIRYELEKPSLVNLSIFNLCGEHVKTLQTHSQQKGLHYISWNGLSDAGKSSGSGMYFCCLQTEQSIQNIKLLLMK